MGYIICPNCGSDVTGNMKFCCNCGFSLKENGDEHNENEVFLRETDESMENENRSVCDTGEIEPSNQTLLDMDEDAVLINELLSEQKKKQEKKEQKSKERVEKKEQKNKEKEEKKIKKEEKKTADKERRKALLQNKKVRVALGVLGIALVFLVLVMTHTICLTHSYMDATVLEPKTCSYCGKTQGEPKELQQIKYPTQGAFSLLPTPKSNMGEMERDSSDYCSVFVGNTTLSDYNDYVNECLDAGFNIDYNRYDDWFGAYDEYGNELDIYYKGNDIMYIAINLSDEMKENIVVGDVNELIDETKADLEPYFEVMGVDVTDGNPDVTDEFVDNMDKVSVMGILGTVEHEWNDIDGRQIIKLLVWSSNDTYTNDEFMDYLELLNKLFGVEYVEATADNIPGNGYAWLEYSKEYSAISWYENNRINIRWKIEDESKDIKSEDVEDTTANETSDSTSTSSYKNFCEASGCYQEGTKSYVGISGATEYYCTSHYNELIDMMSDMEEDVGSGSYSKHTCEECSREGTHSMIGISGSTEYYCSTHYSQLKDMMDSMGMTY